MATPAPPGDSRAARLRHGAGLVLSVAGMQALVQACTLVTGIVIVRTLRVDEYALYTLAMTVLMTALGLADAGITSGAMAEGGKVWRQPERLAAVVATAGELRRRATPWVAVFALPVAMVVLHRHGAGAAQLVILLGLLCALFAASLATSVLEIPFKLRQELGVLQRIQLAAAALRLLLVAGATWLAGLASVALGAGALAQVWALRRLYRRLDPDTMRARPDPAVRVGILRTVRYTFPGVLYFSVAGQLNVWLLSVLGTSTAIAQVGALGRLAAVLSVFSAAAGLVAAPRFARLENRRVLVVRFFVIAALGSSAFGAVIFALVAWFPNHALWILGPAYRDLHAEALLIVAASCLSLVGGTLAGLLASRALLVHPALAIPIGVFANIVALLAVDPSTPTGVLTMSLYTAAFGAAFTLLAGLLLIRRDCP